MGLEPTYNRITICPLTNSGTATVSLERFARSFQHPQCYGLSISLQRQNKRFYTVYLLQPALCGYIPKEPRFTTLEACTHSRSRQPSRQTFCIWFPIIYITGDRRVGLLSTGSEPVILTVVRIPKIAAVPRIGLGLHGSRPCELTTILYRYTAQLFYKSAARLNAEIVYVLILSTRLFPRGQAKPV